MNKEENTRGTRPRKFQHRPEKPRMDEDVKKVIDACQHALATDLKPFTIEGLNGFQRKQVYQYFEKTREYNVKTYKHEEETVIKVYPVGNLKRLAEQKAQEVLMTGEPGNLPPLGSYERFVIHDYLKERGGVRTASAGEGEERHVEIHPIYGRTPKKAKKRLT